LSTRIAINEIPRLTTGLKPVSTQDSLRGA
jgi:hypothetical protein